MPDTFDYSQIEERIRPHVQWMRSQGIKTFASCGHEMYVMVDWPLNAVSALYGALILKYGGDFEIQIVPGPNAASHPWIKVKLTGDLEGDGKPEVFDLLKVEPASHPLYFIVRARKYDDDPDRSYFYDEHTCPTNWTGNIDAVISASNSDPHGFATFVRRLPVPDDFDDLNGDWSEIFPEVFK